MDLDAEGLDVVGAVRAAREVAQVELDLVPALVEAHGHGADEGLHSGGGLVVTGSEPPPHILVIQDLDLECEVLLHVLDDHDEVGQLDTESLLGVRGTRDEGGAHVSPDNLQDE